MMLSHIVAVAKNGAIGRGGKMPWHISSELKHFKAKTTGHILLMGRKTMSSLQKPLSDRFNIVLSRQLAEGEKDGFWVCSNMQNAIKLCEQKITEGWPEEVFCIGGADLYQQTQELCQKVYLTEVDIDILDADAFYSKNHLNKFIEKSRAEFVDSKSGITLRYMEYVLGTPDKSLIV